MLQIAAHSITFSEIELTNKKQMVAFLSNLKVFPQVIHKVDHYREMFSYANKK